MTHSATRIEDYANATAAKFEELILRFESERAEMERIPLMADIGIVQVWRWVSLG